VTGTGQEWKKVRRSRNMDSEFHYHITYLIATRGGFDCGQAHTIAYSSQFVDDNVYRLMVNKGQSDEFCNYISQTYDILKPKNQLMRIYPLFHFIPGDPDADSAKRKDGRTNPLNTTPDSKNASAIIDEALRTQDMHRIGIASHSYVDTWAHQNFTGHKDDFNMTRNWLTRIWWRIRKIDVVGHMAALCKPDRIALSWSDRRLKSGSFIDNFSRFKEAAGRLFEKYRTHVDPSGALGNIDADREDLIHDLSWAAGINGREVDDKDRRIDRYLHLSMKPEYGGREIPTYDYGLWFRAAIKEVWKPVTPGEVLLYNPREPIREYSWRDPALYHQSAWYRFQAAVKDHQDFAWKLMEKGPFKDIELD
jgi:hypothetical protein